MLSDFLGGPPAEASMHQPSPRLAATTARRASANAAPAPSRSPGSPGIAAIWKRNDIMAEPCRRLALHSRVTCRPSDGAGRGPSCLAQGVWAKAFDPRAQAASRQSESVSARAAWVAPNHSSIGPTLASLFPAVRLLER